MVHDDVQRSPRQPLDAETRTSTEAPFGHDFGRVLIHTGQKAAESEQAVDALAYFTRASVLSPSPVPLADGLPLTEESPRLVQSKPRESPRLVSPDVHEAISMHEGDNGSGIVLDVVEKGYKLGDNVIRPARVVVSS